MRRAVLLEHRPPEGEVHLDWLIDPVGGGSPDDRELITFRVGLGTDPRDAPAFDALRLQDHRRLYLDHEGAVPGGRGVVRRIAAGRALEVRPGRASLTLVIDWGGGPIVYDGRAGSEDDPNWWRFIAHPGADR